MALQLNASNPATSTGAMNPVTPPAGTQPATERTAFRAINFALKDAKLIGTGDDATSEQLAELMPRLNEVVNLAQAQPGLKLWLNEDVSWTPVQGYNAYQFGATVSNTVAGTYFVVPRPPRFVEGFWQDTASGARRPLIVLSRNEWDFLSTLTSQGPVNSYFIDKQQNWTTVWLWMTPDQYSATDGMVHMIAQVQVNQFVSLTDTMNFPLEWFNWMHWALAVQVANGQPVAVQQYCKAMRDEAWEVLSNWDVEDTSTFFQPDQRTQYATNSFR